VKTALAIRKSSLVEERVEGVCEGNQEPEALQLPPQRGSTLHSMNIRIQEIADQAREQVPKGILAPDLWIQEYNKIFAQLIIQECVSISRTSTDGFSAGRRMEEHFGVK